MQTTIDHTGNYVTLTDEPAVPTLTQRAVQELSEFNGQIASLQPYGELTVAADGIGKVEEAHKAVKRLKTAVEKKRVELKEGALEYGRTVDSIAKQLKAAIDVIEGKLGAERERYEAEREAEKKAKEAEKQAVIQARIDQCTAEGIPVVIEKVSLPEDEFLWWFATEKKAAQKRREGQWRAGFLKELGASSELDLGELSKDDWLRVLAVAKSECEQRQARIEEERKAAEEFEAQQRAEREALAAKLKAEQEELQRQRAELNRQQEEIAATLREAQEKRRAEERKRREDAAKPELERLQGRLAAMDSLEWHEPMPWWAPEFVTRFNQFSAMMEDFVREGEG